VASDKHNGTKIKCTNLANVIDCGTDFSFLRVLSPPVEALFAFDSAESTTALRAFEPPYWFGLQPVMEQRITGLRLIWPDEISPEEMARDIAANGYTVKLLNKLYAPRALSLGIEGLPGAKLSVVGLENETNPIVTVPPDELKSIRLYVNLDKQAVAALGGVATNFDIVVTRSNAGPSMHSAWTSDEIVSGMKPLASMARAVLKANDPLPWPISKITPRLRAASTAGLTLPWALAGVLGNGRNAWVSTSPGRSRLITSS